MKIGCCEAYKLVNKKCQKFHALEISVLQFYKQRKSGEGEENFLCLSWVDVMFSSFSSVQSLALWPHEPQHARPPCPSPTPVVHPNPCPLSQWCHLTISPSVVPFCCHQSFPESWSFPVSQLFTSGDQSLEFERQHQFFQWTPELISFRMDWLDLLAVQRTLKSLLQHHSSKASNLWHSAFFTVQLSHPYMTTGKTHSLD